MSEFVAELLGTWVLILLGNGVVANVVLKGTKGNGGGWIVITLAWGLAVFTGVVIAGPHSGAHLNPAVSVGLAVAGLFEWSKVPYFVIAQLTGAFLGACTVWMNYKDFYKQSIVPEDKLATFATGPAIRNLPVNFINEVTGTFVLVLTILFFTDPIISLQGVEGTKIGLGSLGALPVALLVTVIGLSLGGTTGYAINPARDLAPRVAHALLPVAGKGPNDWSYAWLPVVAPIVGASMAAVLFLVVV